MKGLRHDFHVLTLESAFVIRTFFFVMFGATVVLSSLMNVEVLFYGLTISVILYVVCTVCRLNVDRYNTLRASYEV